MDMKTKIKINVIRIKLTYLLLIHKISHNQYKSLKMMLTTTDGYIDEVCIPLNIKKTEIVHWTKINRYFKNIYSEIQQIRENCIDYTEAKLLKLVEEHDIAAIIFKPHTVN